MSTGQLSADAVKYLEEKRVTYLLEELFHDVLRNLPENPLEFLLKALERKTTLHLIIVGPPGSGKQTQARRIAKRYDAVHVRAQDIFLNEVKRRTPEGEIIERCMRDGEQVPSHISSELVIRRLREDDVVKRGWVLDGFPQTRSQALRLQTAGLSPLLFVMLDVGNEVSVKRCAGRRYEPITRNIYHIEYLPAPSGMHLELMSPDDESRAAVASRWKYFDARRGELVGCYEPMYVRIDGDRPFDTVFAEICEQVDSRFVSV
ncbi:adenylate kinase [Trypanosoma brucei equiperdum]|uniref:Adenylate kinase n=1 Tax=Trypanosoma brucei equiperdum TaxID=630700 RepID=A0A3L6LDU4_9TRYP|nr:adenylate kinase [Trypanosoma brucei equiperdum]